MARRTSRREGDRAGRRGTGAAAAAAAAAACRRAHDGPDALARRTRGGAINDVEDARSPAAVAQEPRLPRPPPRRRFSRRCSSRARSARCAADLDPELTVNIYDLGISRSRLGKTTRSGEDDPTATACPTQETPASSKSDREHSRSKECGRGTGWDPPGSRDRMSEALNWNRLFCATPAGSARRDCAAVG